MPDSPTGGGTREKILAAAATMLGEDPTARLSVRAVAARAGVSTGSLRHFFPTQRLLVDAVVDAVSDLDIPDDPIHDTDVPPAERLVACLRQHLAQIGTGARAREYWRGVHDSYIAADLSADDVARFRSLERLGLHFFERWLRVLADEGVVPADDVERRARFLGTVLNGLAVERALPADARRAAFETDALRLAAEAVLGDPTSPPD